MEKSGPLGPTCVLKLNLQCCKACPLKVRKQLKKIKEVTYIDIDTEEGLVTVSGVADASILIKAIKKVGRNAKLCKFEMHPKTEKDTHDGDDHSNDHHHSNGNAHLSNGSGALGSNNVTTILSNCQNNQYPQITMRSGYNSNNNGGYFFPRPPPMPQPLYPHSRPYTYHQFALSHPNNCYQQCPPLPPPSLSRVLPPPPPPPPSYHGQHMHFGDGSLDNNFIHTFSDENAKACSIM